jgi:ribosomal protein S18 acetylase RimI-like enzyme
VNAVPVAIRPAVRNDAARLAALHADRISEGFLPQLGPAFLTRLYRRIVASPAGFATVASVDGRVVGFAAGATDLGAVYKSFVLRDGVPAAVGAAPQLLRSWRRVLETLRYPDSTGDLPDAEILAVAVDAAIAGRGVGRDLVAACQVELDARGVRTAKVVAGADNAPALALYTRCGFLPRARIEVHAGTVSEVLVWTSSS